MKIEYDSTIISITDILTTFFNIIDPTQKNKQGNDTGTNYRTGIYYVNASDLNVIKEYFGKMQNVYDN